MTIAQNLAKTASDAAIANQTAAARLKAQQEAAAAEADRAQRSAGKEEAHKRYPNCLAAIRLNAERGIFETRLNGMGWAESTEDGEGPPFGIKPRSGQDQAMAEELKKMLEKEGFNVYERSHDSEDSRDRDWRYMSTEYFLVVVLPDPSAGASKSV